MNRVFWPASWLLPGQTGNLLYRNHPHQNLSQLLSVLNIPKICMEIASRGCRWGLFMYHYLGFPEAGMSFIFCSYLSGAGAAHLGCANKGVEQRAPC